jgi:hypothetical protein
VIFLQFRKKSTVVNEKMLILHNFQRSRTSFLLQLLTGYDITSSTGGYNSCPIQQLLYWLLCQLAHSVPLAAILAVSQATISAAPLDAFSAAPPAVLSAVPMTFLLFFFLLREERMQKKIHIILYSEII